MLNRLIITLPLIASKQYWGQPWTIVLTDDHSLFPSISGYLYHKGDRGRAVNLATITLSWAESLTSRGRRV